jgi:hypothetical protein
MERIKKCSEGFFVFYRPYFDAKVKAENELKVSKRNTSLIKTNFFYLESKSSYRRCTKSNNSSEKNLSYCIK